VYELGELLKKLRGKISLREAAKRSGLSYSYISSLEKGKHPRTGAAINPTPDILRSLANAYDYPYEELMKLAGYLSDEEKEQTHPADKLREYLDSGLTNEEIKKRMDFFVDFMQLNNEQVEEFLSFVRWQLSRNAEPLASQASSSTSHKHKHE
jgi:transcriptional regulator with XRE-family HTH domain